MLIQACSFKGHGKVIRKSEQVIFFRSRSNYVSPSLDKRKYVRGWVPLALLVLLPQVIMNLRDTHTRVLSTAQQEQEAEVEEEEDVNRPEYI